MRDIFSYTVKFLKQGGSHGGDIKHNAEGLLVGRLEVWVNKAQKKLFCGLLNCRGDHCGFSDCERTGSRGENIAFTSRADTERA